MRFADREKIVGITRNIPEANKKDPNSIAAILIQRRVLMYIALFVKYDAFTSLTSIYRFFFHCLCALSV